MALTGRWRRAWLVLSVTLLAACAVPSGPRPPVTPSPTSGVAATQTPAAPATVLGVATMTEGRCQCSTLHLISVAGSELGSVTLDAGAQPPLAAGPQGIYYVLGYQLMRLGADGSTTEVGTVARAPGGAGSAVRPDPELGSLAVAPGADQWAYLQSISSGGNQTEQVWLGEANRGPRLLVSTEQSPGAPSTEFPGGWTYQLMGWAGGYLVLAQMPNGSGSFASLALEVSLVNPQTGTETVVSNSQNCPISAVGASGGYVCFQQGGGQATELVTEAAGISTGAWPLPSGSGYGAAAFDRSGKQILFSNCEGCGASPSAADLGSQMEVLDTETGSIRQLGAAGLVSDAWLANGQIVATQYSQLAYARRGSPPLSQVVLVDPASGQVTAITDDATSQFAGIATS